NGSAPFVPTLVVGFVLVLLRRLFALGAYASHAFGILVKGKPVVIVENGRIDRKNMRVNHITQHDLEEDMRLDAQIEDPSKIKIARVERSVHKKRDHLHRRRQGDLGIPRLSGRTTRGEMQLLGSRIPDSFWRAA